MIRISKKVLFLLDEDMNCLNYVRKYRQLLELDKCVVYRYIGVGKQRYDSIEKGRNEVTKREKEKICELFNCDLHIIFPDEKPNTFLG